VRIGYEPRDKGKMNTVLIVEDDKVLQGFLRTRLQKNKERLEIILADNGEEAIKILKQRNISLLVTDIVMPKVDGLELLAYMSENHPDIPCIVMTGHASELAEKLSEDKLRLFQKPFQLDDLNQAIIQALEQDVPGGTLRGISVASFLQMIEMEQKTCLIEVHLPGKEKGIFYFVEGELQDAEHGSLKGEAAAYRIIAWDKASIRCMKLPNKKIEKRINTELTSLIMESMRRKDESNE
jgi:CheY-like chemotaxis protein